MNPNDFRTGSETTVARLTCRDLILQHLDAYVDGTLAAELLGDFEYHLTRCPACVAYLHTYRRTREMSREAAVIATPSGMRAELRQFLLTHLHDE